MPALPPQPDPAAPGRVHPDGRGRWHVRLLGGFEVQGQQHSPARLPSRAATALLARLALQPEREHGREELIELLWPGVELAVGRNRLRQTLSTLKALLEPPGQPAVIVADRRCLRVAPNALSSDARAFEQLMRAGQWGAAAACYGGELLPGFFDEWVQEERRRLAALAERADALSPALSTTPTRAPDTPAPQPAPAPPLQAMSRHGLPSYLTRGFGQDGPAAALRDRVQAHRLVTLIGPGGIGKTRLAVDLVRTLRERAADAGDPDAAFDTVAFVSLSTCHDLPSMFDALAAAFGLQAGDGDALDPLVQRLDGQRTLLVLDNLEQLLPQAAPVLARLLGRTVSLHLLATSRRALAVDGEQTFALQPLPTPPDDASAAQVAEHAAVALFVDRARAVRADFHLSARNAASVAALVAALQGLPLAIELAAARVRSMGLGDMLQRLAPIEQGGPPQGRLALLSRPGPRAGVDPRQASMTRVIAWSWDLLDAPVRQLLASLTVFVGGFTAEAAGAVTGSDVALLIDDAVQHSLLDLLPQADGGLRFRLSEPVREFADDHLADTLRPALRQRHRSWARSWADALPVTPPLQAVRSEMPNLVAALTSAVTDGVPEQAIQLALALRPAIDEVVLPGSGLQHLVLAVRACADPALRAAGAALASRQAFERGQREEAGPLSAQALADAPPGSPEQAWALQAAGALAWTAHRDRDTLRRLVDQGLPIAERHHDLPTQCALLNLRAYALHFSLGDHAGALALFERAAALRAEVGNRHTLRNAWYHLANAAEAQGRLDEAAAGFQRVCDSARSEDDDYQLSMAADALGNVQVRQRQWSRALPSFSLAAEVAWARGDLMNWVYALWNVPSALVRCGQPAAALQLMTYARACWIRHYGELMASDERQVQRLTRLARACLGAAASAEARAAGLDLGMRQAMQVFRDAVTAARPSAAEGDRSA